MKRLLFFISVSVTFFPLPGLTVEDLNAQLRAAVCSQNWSQAIQVIDKMSAAYPAYRPTLILYRSRLLAILSDGGQFAISQDCLASNPPSAAATQPLSRIPSSGDVPLSGDGTRDLWNDPYKTQY
jgi:hypothetical protein